MERVSFTPGTGTERIENGNENVKVNSTKKKGTITKKET